MECMSTIAARSCGPLSRTAAAFWPMMLPQTSAIRMTLASGVAGSTNSTAAGANRLRHKPAATGSTTTCRVETSRPSVSISTSLPANTCVNSGVSTTAASVEQVVIVTERATSARAM